jgi:hypothetical protein
MSIGVKEAEFYPGGGRGNSKKNKEKKQRTINEPNLADTCKFQSEATMTRPSKKSTKRYFFWWGPCFFLPQMVASFGKKCFKKVFWANGDESGIRQHPKLVATNDCCKTSGSESHLTRTGGGRRTNTKPIKKIF